MHILGYQIYQAGLRECMLNRKPHGSTFSKPCLINFISKDTIYQFLSCFTRQTSDYDRVIDFRVNSTSLTTLFKKCKVMMT